MPTTNNSAQATDFTGIRRDRGAIEDWDLTNNFYDHEVWIATVSARAGMGFEQARRLILPNNQRLSRGEIDLATFQEVLVENSIPIAAIQWLEDYAKAKPNEPVIEAKRKYIDAGVPFAVLTNEDRTRALVIRDQLNDRGLRGVLVDEPLNGQNPNSVIPIILPSDTGFVKPQRGAWLQAMRILQGKYGWSLNPEDIAYVDDVEKNITAAKMAYRGRSFHLIQYESPEDYGRKLEKFLTYDTPAHLQHAEKVASRSRLRH